MLLSWIQVDIPPNSEKRSRVFTEVVFSSPVLLRLLLGVALLKKTADWESHKGRMLVDLVEWERPLLLLLLLFCIFASDKWVDPSLKTSSSANPFLIFPGKEGREGREDGRKVRRNSSLLSVGQVGAGGLLAQVGGALLVKGLPCVALGKDYPCSCLCFCYLLDYLCCFLDDGCAI